MDPARVYTGSIRMNGNNTILGMVIFCLVMIGYLFPAVAIRPFFDMLIQVTVQSLNHKEVIDLISPVPRSP